MMRIRIAHLYADVMNVYGDRGNALALAYRARARGIDVETVDVAVGAPFDVEQFDLMLVGGGQDGEQRRVADDLLEKGPSIRSAVADGLPCLAVCGGYQLFGRSYVDDRGARLPGIGVFDLETRHSGRREKRCVGNVVLKTRFGDVVGFENHGGRTFLDPGQAPFGELRTGFGNNAKDRTEGAVSENAIGTYLHGSLLPKNPAVTDHLLLTALRRTAANVDELEPLDDHAESAARSRAIDVALGGRLRRGG